MDLFLTFRPLTSGLSTPPISASSSTDPAFCHFHHSFANPYSFASFLSLSHLAKPQPWLKPLSSQMHPCEGGPSRLEKITGPHRLAHCIFRSQIPAGLYMLHPGASPICSPTCSHSDCKSSLLFQTCPPPPPLCRKPHLLPSHK